MTSGEVAQPAVKLSLCKYCGSEYESSGSLSMHIKRKHADRMYRCLFCNEFARAERAALIAHSITCSLPEGEHLHCAMCQRSFGTVKLLQQHERRHLPGGDEALLTIRTRGQGADAAHADNVLQHLRAGHRNVVFVCSLKFADGAIPCPLLTTNFDLFDVHLEHYHGVEHRGPASDTRLGRSLFGTAQQNMALLAAHDVRVIAVVSDIRVALIVLESRAEKDALPEPATTWWQARRAVQSASSCVVIRARTSGGFSRQGERATVDEESRWRRLWALAFDVTRSAESPQWSTAYLFTDSFIRASESDGMEHEVSTLCEPNDATSIYICAGLGMDGESEIAPSASVNETKRRKK